MEKKKLKIIHIFIFLLLISTAFIIYLSLLTYNVNDNSFFQYNSSILANQNLLGSFGALLSDLLFRTLGMVSYLIPIVLIIWSIRLIWKKENVSWLSVAVFPLLLINLCHLLTIVINKDFHSFTYGYGGFVGRGLNESLNHYLNKFPIIYINLTSLLLFLFFLTLTLKINYKFLQILKIILYRSFNSFFSLILFALRIQRNNPRFSAKNKQIKSSKKKKVNINYDYTFPSLNFLEKPLNQNNFESENSKNIQKNTLMLANVLKDFNINGEITSVKQGPIVTLYELTPAPGTKNASVIGLSADIARSMSAISARISAIPGRDAIGIEIPNKQSETVYLRELIDNESYNNTLHSLPLVLGKDILGKAVIVDLAKMPHLLVAGTTGSGKSVGINAMILSLLYNSTPEDCRLILIDPKMLELSVYKDIPHLLTEVVTDPKKAVSALKWTVKEMESRYQLMTQIGVREIEAYNIKVKKLLDRGEVIQKEVQVGFDSETGKPLIEKRTVDLRIFPKIVVVVDELADLMITSGKEIEAAIQRLSQMARAAGIHLIVATQRPSVDVITGTIKSNFPSRISYQVQSKIDSRTILGEQGGEQLLGRGDLLITMIGQRLLRVHGPFVKTHEVESVVKHLIKQGEPEYLDSVTHEEEENLSNLNLEHNDELYNQAIAIVCREKKASTSFIQRQLQIGYNRAARIIEKMESEGIVSPANHVGRREVLVGKEV